MRLGARICDLGILSMREAIGKPRCSGDVPFGFPFPGKTGPRKPLLGEGARWAVFQRLPSEAEAVTAGARRWGAEGARTALLWPAAAGQARDVLEMGTRGHRVLGAGGPGAFQTPDEWA